MKYCILLPLYRAIGHAVVDLLLEENEDDQNRQDADENARSDDLVLALGGAQIGVQSRGDRLIELLILQVQVRRELQVPQVRTVLLVRMA